MLIGNSDFAPNHYFVNCSEFTILLRIMKAAWRAGVEGRPEALLEGDTSTPRAQTVLLL